MTSRIKHDIILKAVEQILESVNNVHSEFEQLFNEINDDRSDLWVEYRQNHNYANSERVKMQMKRKLEAAVEKYEPWARNGSYMVTKLENAILRNIIDMDKFVTDEKLECLTELWFGDYYGDVFGEDALEQYISEINHSLKEMRRSLLDAK